MVLKFESLHVLLMEKGTIGNAYWVREVFLDVVNMDTKLEIVLLG